ncbi:MAG: class I SAM-dependent methyltransferase [Planctomycetes bacterium]|nr:class I SAM-dependent methyltransferase [Planctomycetota bacterium]
MALATSTVDAVTAAIARRADLRRRLHADGTDCYRLFHGITEGEPGLTIDRYGTLLLAQTFRAPLTHDEADRLGDVVRAAGGLDLPFCCNHRGELPPGFPTHEPTLPALDEHVAHEHAAAFTIRARHRGQDPWLFLDLRVARQRIRELALGRAVLNLFAYTCGVGIVAALGGARSVLNVDFATSALAVGTQNAGRNGIGSDRFQVLQSDCIPVLRQLAGLPVQRRGKHRPYARVERQAYDLVCLDPPRWAKGPFGAIDVEHDYQSLFKPCLLTLAPGGIVVATNHLPQVSREQFAELLRRCAEKAGRPLVDLQIVGPGEDFPSADGQPPLKVAVARIGG